MIKKKKTITYEDCSLYAERLGLEVDYEDTIILHHPQVYGFFLPHTKFNDYPALFRFLMNYHQCLNLCKQYEDLMYKRGGIGRCVLDQTLYNQFIFKYRGVGRNNLIDKLDFELTCYSNDFKDLIPCLEGSVKILQDVMKEEHLLSFF
jgi:hypothetical protein